MKYWCKYHLQLGTENGTEIIELERIDEIWVRYKGEASGLGFLSVGFEAGSHRYVRAAASASDRSLWIHCIYTEVGRSREHPGQVS